MTCSGRPPSSASLLGEAQAMAKLTHPNVIPVYDAGTFNDQVFLAMEFIRGRDLRSRLTEAQRPWKQIVLRRALPPGLDLTEPRASLDLLTLDTGLDELAGLDTQQSRIVELRYFGA